MSRTNRFGSEFDTYIGPKPTVDRLRHTGMSIFRSLVPDEVQPVISATSESLDGAITLLRGTGHEKPPGINLLEMSEVKRQRRIGHVPVTCAIDRVYRSVSSLGHSFDATPDRVELFGRGNDGEGKVLVVVFDRETEDRLTDERQAILKALEGLDETEFDFKWLIHKRPHISLARLSAALVKKATAECRHDIAQSLPTKFTLKRATLYNPSRDSK